MHSCAKLVWNPRYCLQLRSGPVFDLLVSRPNQCSRIMLLHTCTAKFRRKRDDAPKKSATIAGRLAPTTVTATAEQSRSALSFQTCYGEAQSGRYKLWGGDCRQDQQAGHAARAKSVRRQSGGESSEQGARTGRLPLQSGVSWFLKRNIQRCGAESCGSVIRDLQMGPMRIRLIL